LKNFGLAILTFFVWAFIGLWYHTYTHTKKKEPTDIVMPKKKLPKTNTYVKDSLNKMKSDSITKSVTKKTLSKKILYLGFDKKTFTENKIIDNYLKDLKKYITTNKNAQIYVVGYTDSIGTETDNYWIGNERANNFRLFLISKGIKKERIHASSKGENNPINKNNSLESRRKNRRIEITVKPN